jgi:predicted glycoside hydrolase/deacetylase ChbG (UPF0249 family)
VSIQFNFLNPGSQRLVVAHQDDVGMCHGANVAFERLFGRGLISSGSVMVPCPWFLEAADIAGKRADMDMGVHLTLTSEWKHYRWRPLTGARASSGLVDADGYMWPTVRKLRENAVSEAVEAELRAQIDAALAAGIDVTHLDTHMGAALAPEYSDIYIRLGAEYRLPILMPRAFEGYGCASTFGNVDTRINDLRALQLEKSGTPIFDAFYESPWVASADSRSAYENLLRSLTPGLSFLALHCNAPGDIEVIDPPRAHCRTDEFTIFQDTAFLKLVDELAIKLVSFREIRTMIRA